MRNIEVKILNPGILQDIEKMTVGMARLTQRGHKITNMSDFEELLSRDYTDETIKRMVDLPHNTISRFGTINIAVVGASRRFLAQITRHQAGVTFMSGSLQYSDYGDDAQFVVPYEVQVADRAAYGQHGGQDTMPSDIYLESCKQSMEAYRTVAETAGNDAAGYAAPQGLRNVLVISANATAWMHMLSLRTCRRNTKETQYVMLLIARELQQASSMFNSNVMPTCLPGTCNEGHMSCGKPVMSGTTASDMLVEDFKLIMEV